MSMLNTMLANTSKVSFIDYDPGDSRIVECKYAILDYPNHSQVLFTYGFMPNITGIGNVIFELPKAPKYNSRLYVQKIDSYKNKDILIWAKGTEVKLNIDSDFIGADYFYAMYEI